MESATGNGRPTTPTSSRGASSLIDVGFALFFCRSRVGCAVGRPLPLLEITASTLGVEHLASPHSAPLSADLLQLQANFWRGSFDRFVEESASLTESMVKLAGESFQPISNRTSANVERINDLVA